MSHATSLIIEIQPLFVSIEKLLTSPSELFSRAWKRKERVIVTRFHVEPSGSCSKQFLACKILSPWEQERRARAQILSRDEIIIVKSFLREIMLVAFRRFLSIINLDLYWLLSFLPSILTRTASGTFCSPTALKSALKCMSQSIW